MNDYNKFPKKYQVNGNKISNTDNSHHRRQNVKSPYEIRADLLRLAFDILQTRTVSDGTEKTGISTTDVITEAAKLNTFVSTTKDP